MKPYSVNVALNASFSQIRQVVAWWLLQSGGGSRIFTCRTVTAEVLGNDRQRQNDFFFFYISHWGAHLEAA